MSDRKLIALLCLAEVLGMLGISTFSALLPELQIEWALSNSAAGWINGIYYGGYLLAVPVLVSLTDRIDARGVYLASTALGGIALLGFALFADGFWTALLFRALAGVALAGTHMPGLKALTDRIDGPAQARAVALYTSAFGVGVALSFLVSGEIVALLDWRWAFGLLALGAPLAMAVGGWVLTVRPGTRHPVPDTHLLDFRPVFRNREAMAYILAYAAHNWELFGFRGWIVAFLVYSQAMQPEYSGWNITMIVAVVSILAVPSSIFGGEMAMRLGRRRWVIGVMTASAFIAATYGYIGALPFPFVAGMAMFYGLFISADSAAITTGAVGAAPPGGRGAVMAVHACLGFIGAFLGPLAFGIALDIGGADTAFGWGLAFTAMGLGVLMGPIVMLVLGAKLNEPGDGPRRTL